MSFFCHENGEYAPQFHLPSGVCREAENLLNVVIVVRRQHDSGPAYAVW